MKKGLTVSLTMAQIEAANELHQGLPQWKNTDDALHGCHAESCVPTRPNSDIRAVKGKIVIDNWRKKRSALGIWDRQMGQEMIPLAAEGQIFVSGL